MLPEKYVPRVGNNKQPKCKVLVYYTYEFKLENIHYILFTYISNNIVRVT